MDPSLHFSPYPIPRIGCLLLSCFAALASADDQALRWLLLVARLDAFLVAPLVHDVAATARTTTMRVIDRVHDFTANLGTHAEPAALAGLAMRQQLVLGVADRSDGPQAVAVHHAHLGRRHAERHVLSLFGNDLKLGSRGARHLPTRARLQLDAVHVGAERDLAERKRVADETVRD